MSGLFSVLATLVSNIIYHSKIPSQSKLKIIASHLISTCKYKTFWGKTISYWNFWSTGL